MKILLDENLPHDLANALAGHEVVTVQTAGWAGITNGDLLDRAEGKFDALITADKNLRYQQNLTQRKISILELPTNRLPVLKTMEAKIIEAIGELKPGDYRVCEMTD